MLINFQCNRCAKPYATDERFAGRSAHCKQCGAVMQVPKPRAAAPAPAPAPAAEPELDVYGLADVDDILPVEQAVADPLPRGASGVAAAAPLPRGQAKAKSGGWFGVLGPRMNGMGVLGVVCVFMVIVIDINRYFNLLKNRPDAPGAQASGGLDGPLPDQPWMNDPAMQVQPGGGVAAAMPITLPNFPDPGPGRVLEPGVVLHEIALGPPDAGPGIPPGHCGKLWLYLPEGEHAPRSLPCVLITGAGSNLITGMDLGDGDRPEHLPYVRAGFAVLAYELDGVLRDKEHASEAELARCIRAYVAAKAGVVNARNALEYALARVPAIDPERLFAAGHSSAATMALLFAENEPRLKACVAYAPVVDIASHVPPTAVAAIERAIPESVALFTTDNPARNESRLNCPVFLFTALTDPNVPASHSTGLADRLRQAGKPVTLETVPNGDHYNVMIQIGIPRAIAWLKSQAGMP